MKKYQAPEHVTGIHCPSGNEYRADEKGHVHLKKDAPQADHQALKGAGFKLIEDEAQPAAEAQPKSK